MKKGPLVKVELRPGQFVKMYEADAIEQGLIPGKSKPPAKDKMRYPERDKGASHEAPEPEQKSEAEQPPDPAAELKPEDDFTSISGVGPATARALAANGITTFEQLMYAGELDFVSSQTMQAIEEWREEIASSQAPRNEGAERG